MIPFKVLGPPPQSLQDGPFEGTSSSKRLGSRYRSGRSEDWLKFKNPEAPCSERRGLRKGGAESSGGTSMANDEHVAMLKNSVDAWNEWRRENPEICPDLSGADLFCANRKGANLSGGHLDGADLRQANLIEPTSAGPTSTAQGSIGRT
jgi:Pentapeptide repeats (8 copies)